VENNEVRILSIRENAKAELQQLKTIEDGMVHLSKLEGIEAWVKAQKLDAEIHALVLEQELRTKRIVGQILKAGREAGEIATQSRHPRSVVAGDTVPKTLQQIGLTRDQSADFVKLASIPEEVFEEHIAEAKAEVDQAVKKLTTTGAVKLAEQLSGKRSDSALASDTGLEKEKRDATVKEFVDKINALPKLYRMQIKERIK
jgi:hypothetical protein